MRLVLALATMLFAVFVFRAPAAVAGPVEPLAAFDVCRCKATLTIDDSCDPCNSATTIDSLTSVNPCGTGIPCVESIPGQCKATGSVSFSGGTGCSETRNFDLSSDCSGTSISLYNCPP